MTYKQIKWMILFIPTVTLGVWEYVRHEYLLSYISMEIGNWITPLIVYVLSITLLNKLFHMLERIQRELEHERAAKSALEAREKLAIELHDGIAQSLFLLSVKVDRLEVHEEREHHLQEVYTIRKTVHEVNCYVRQAIANLRYDPAADEALISNESLDNKVRRMADEVFLDMDVDWSIPDYALNPKEKVELLACIQEAIVNIEKHAVASKGWIHGEGDEYSWKVTIKDNGKGFEMDQFQPKDRYGLNIMKERTENMNWRLQLERDHQYTIVELTKEGEIG
ncbi:sensor histidine kinase [Paenibacillus glacialis]|uniref:histidine kinase n=1 Tax=Paenibacillus glacialis TaxID=494026 RepID=A0A168JMK3_9BACL|nr:histidine kinase [Paenibacillus glacialis]OAB40839.1 two-component sensor histidine kinase [Paenibacillus glacialis]